MALRVAFDLDGTIADLGSEITRLAAEMFGAVPSAKPASGTRPHRGLPAPSIGNVDLTDRQLTEMWDHIRTVDGFWTSLHETEAGIVARIAAVAAARRWEVLFITTRPPAGGDTTQRQSQEWLEAQGFRWPSVVVSRGSRGSIVAALGYEVLVDDRPENCVDVCAESKASALLVWPPEKGPAPSGAARLGITVVASAGEAVDLLEALDDERKTPRFLRSVKKLLRRG